MRSSSEPGWGVSTPACAAILMVTMGARQSFGLFISPLSSSTGLGIATISLAFAVAQLMWGVIQPVSGAVADRYGPEKVLIAGVLSAIGSGAASFSVLIGAASQRLPTDKRGKAAGIINAGGSLGQFVFAPVAQTLIQLLGWMGALWPPALI